MLGQIRNPSSSVTCLMMATQSLRNRNWVECSSWLKLLVLDEIALTLWHSFQNPRLLDDVSFHPCIRFKRWESERVLSFIPPDGNFRLISYRVSSQKCVSIQALCSSSYTHCCFPPEGHIPPCKGGICIVLKCVCSGFVSAVALSLLKEENHFSVTCRYSAIVFQGSKSHVI